MRLQHLTLRVPGHEQRLRFHDRMTVIGGIGPQDREGLAEVILGTLATARTISSCLVYADRSGQLVTVEQSPEGTFEAAYPDGSPAPLPRAALGLTVQQLFRLAHSSADDLGLGDQARPVEPRALVEARAALTALTDQLQAAEVARDAAEALRLELLAAEQELAYLDRSRARRRYAALLMQLERAKAEKAALAAGVDEVRSDNHLAAHAAYIRPLAHRWHEACRHLAEMRQSYGSRERLDPDTLAGALAVPDRVPDDLDALATVLRAAEAQREALSLRLAAMMADHLPTPSHPDVARLARADQDRLWAAAYRALETSLRLERESLAVGGLATNGVAPKIVDEIESAHTAVENAREAIEKRRFGAAAAGGAAVLGAVALPLAPLVAPLALAGAASAAYWAVVSPRQLLAEAEGWEEDALVRAGVPSYLAFHLRRVHALRDPTMRVNLERAARDHRQAMAEWRSMAGDLSPGDALELEDEVRAYAASVGVLDGLGNIPKVVYEARRRLAEVVEPAVEEAREALMEVCRPFGIESPTLAVELVRQLAEVASAARLQHALEDAELEEHNSRHELEDALTACGIAEGDLDGRLVAFEDWARGAEHRIACRMRARSTTDIDAEIAHLTERSLNEYRPEFGVTFTASDAVEPDPAELQERLDLKAMAYATASRLVPDLGRIADRRSALIRRVQVLEREHGQRGTEVVGQRGELELRLRERLAGLRSCGATGESLPLILDEAFRSLRSDDKWAALDALHRLADDAQVIYLTADPEVVTWSKRRAASGSVVFFDPNAPTKTYSAAPVVG